MRFSERDRQFLTLVREHRDVTESGIKHLAEWAVAMSQRLDALEGVQAKHLAVLEKILQTVQRVEERLGSGDDPVEIAAELKSVVSTVERLSRNVMILESAVAHGSQRDFPWFHIKGDKNGHKGEQVRKVWLYLKEHEKCRRSRAVIATFEKDPLGYTKRSALMSECRRLKVEKYRWC